MQHDIIINEDLRGVDGDFQDRVSVPQEEQGGSLPVREKIGMFTMMNHKSVIPLKKVLQVASNLLYYSSGFVIVNKGHRMVSALNITRMSLSNALSTVGNSIAEMYPIGIERSR